MMQIVYGEGYIVVMKWAFEFSHIHFASQSSSHLHPVEKLTLLNYCHKVRALCNGTVLLFVHSFVYLLVICTDSSGGLSCWPFRMHWLVFIKSRIVSWLLQTDWATILFMLSGVTPIGQGWTNARGLRGLGGPKPDPEFFLYILICQVLGVSHLFYSTDCSWLFCERPTLLLYFNNNKFFRKFKMWYGAFYVICPRTSVNLLRHCSCRHL